MTATAVHTNVQVFNQLNDSFTIEGENEYLFAADKFASWLSKSPAYYDDARPVVSLAFSCASGLAL
jgi:hypothetical protein